jgi:hypothetical protein
MVAEKIATYIYVIITKYVENTLRILKKHAWQILSTMIYGKKWRVRDTIGDRDFTADW